MKLLENALLLIENESKAKVGYFENSVALKDICWFKVSVDHL